MPNEEIRKLKSKLEVLRKKGRPPEDIVDTLNDLAFAYYRIDPELTEKYAKEAAEIARDSGYSEGIARSLVETGVSYWARGDYGEALITSKKGLSKSKSCGDNETALSAYTIIGLVYASWSDYDIALDYYFKALALCEGLGDKRKNANINNNIGVVYKNRKDFDRALEHFHSALKFYEELDYKIGIAGIYNNIGIINEQLDRTADALEYFQKSLAIKEELGEEITLAGSYNNIGHIYNQQGDFDSSLEYYGKSLKIKEEIGDKQGIVTTYIGIGNVYIRLKDYDLARKYLEDALRIGNEIGVKRQVMQCYQRLSELFEMSGGFKKSLDYYKKYTDMEKELFSEDKNRQLAEIRTKYETEKKEKEAEIYRLKNVELQAAYDKTDDLLRNILPGQIVEELEETSTPKPRIVDDVTVVFIDIVGFTLSTNKNEPEELLNELALHFGAYDEIVKGYGLEKLKTFGDGYMYAGGLFTETNQIEACAETALDILDFVKKREWDVRIGIHVGPCIAGLIKGWRMIYDVWGETVNLAARLEQNGEPGRINVSRAVYDELGDSYTFKYRGKIQVHNVGAIPMYFVDR